MRIAVAYRSLALFGFAVGSLTPQTPPAGPVAAANPVIHVSVNLVQTDAVVTDSKGNQVTDLKAADFEILEDGKPQKITTFSWIDATPPKQLASATGKPAGSLQREDIRRSIVLMVDDTGTHPEYDVLPVMTAARKFVDEQIAPGDLVAVTASRGGMGFYQRFTSDRQQLDAAIDRISNRAGFGRWTVDTPKVPDPDTGDMVPIPLVRDEPNFDYKDGVSPNPVGHLMWAIQGLQTVPGRKAVVLFSHSFAAPPSVVDLANRAGVVIYVIDPHGTDFDMNPRRVRTKGGERIDLGTRSPVIQSVEPYRLLAQQTGGLWIKSSPGANLTADLGKVLEDMSGYYLLGYQPDRSDFELSQGRPVHHRIQVKVERRGLTVRARNGFMGVAEGAPDAVPQTKEELLQQALFSPFSAGGLRLHLDPLYGAPPPDSKTKQRLPLLRAMLAVDGSDVNFVEVGDGTTMATLDVLVAVFNQDGTQAASQNHTFRIHATPEHAAQLKAYGIHGSMDVKLRQSGPYQVRMAVRDATSGTVGSAYSFLNVPDFNVPQIALSSIELSPGGKASAAPASADWNEFAAGTKVHFDCEVFGVTPRLAGDSSVEMEIRLLHEGKTVFDSHPLAVSPQRLSEHLITGNVNIGSDLEPGEYTMQLLAFDRLSPPKKQVASQRVDLTVIGPGSATH